MLCAGSFSGSNDHTIAMYILKNPEVNILPETQAVMVDSVSDWFYEDYEKDKFEFNDFPRAVTPWPNTWLEHRLPRAINKGGVLQVTPKSYKNVNVACYGQTMRFPDGSQKIDVIGVARDVMLEGYPSRTTHELEEIEKRDSAYRKAIDRGELPRWATKYTLCYGKGRRTIPLGEMFVYLDEDGTMMDGLEQVYVGTPPLKEISYEEWGHEFWARIWAFFFAISLLNCDKKIRYKEHCISPKGNHQSGDNLIRYKILDVRPLQTQIRYEKGEKTNIKRALHLVRSHFATYTSATPLFGKYTGTFWKPMHFRGSKKYGEIVKDYRVLVDD